MKSGLNMHARDGWTEVACTESDRVRGAQPVRPSSGLTDLDGDYGPAVQYTEWETVEDLPILRDYVWDPRGERRCEHLVPSS